MHWEVVTSQTPHRGILYHARLKNERDQVIVFSPDYSVKEYAYNAINIVRAYANVPIRETIEQRR
jgi:uncharacterized protein YegP (UPF0339 family)